MALWIKVDRRWKKVLHEIERKTNLKLYVHCLTWPSGLRKIRAIKKVLHEIERKTNLKLYVYCRT